MFPSNFVEVVDESESADNTDKIGKQAFFMRQIDI